MGLSLLYGDVQLGYDWKGSILIALFHQSLLQQQKVTTFFQSDTPHISNKFKLIALHLIFKAEDGVSIGHEGVVLDMCERMYNPNIVGDLMLIDKLSELFGCVSSNIGRIFHVFHLGLAHCEATDLQLSEGFYAFFDAVGVVDAFDGMSPVVIAVSPHLNYII